MKIMILYKTIEMIFFIKTIFKTVVLIINYLVTKC